MEIKDFKWKDEVFLIADDDQYSCLLLDKVLQRTGARVLLAKDGKEALDILLKEPRISVAILDIIMPKLTGYDVIEGSKPFRSDTIFIAYTADIVRLNKARCKELGFYSCVAKPVLPIKLLLMLNEAISQRSEIL